MPVDFSELTRALPPILARTEVHRLTGGAVATGTLANEDSRGTGPRDRFKIGKRTFYHREALIEWLSERARSVEG